jgi:DNA helicase TIP49 (TBP-interacting protein)
LAPLSTEEEDVEVADDAKDLLTKIGVETSLRYEQWLKYRQL